MPDQPNIYDALGGEGEVLERVEQLPWKAVESSNLLRIAFCETSRLPLRGGAEAAMGWLWVQFRSGKIYAYQDVPLVICTLLLEATSHGRAHIALIRGHYRYCAVDPATGATFTEHR